MVEYLLYKHEDLSLDSQYPYKKLSIVVHPHNLSTENEKTGGSLELLPSRSSQTMIPRVSERPYLTMKEESNMNVGLQTPCTINAPNKHTPYTGLKFQSKKQENRLYVVMLIMSTHSIPITG